MDIKEKVKEHYDRVQPIYNKFWMNKKNLGMHYGFWNENTKNLHQAMLNENKEIAEKLKITREDIILDAGCGVGGTSIWIAENYGAKVIGITLSQKQVEAAREYVKNRELAHLVNFYIRDYCSTGFPNDSFTKILAIESVCHAEKKENFIKESFRILKPLGKLIIADFFIKEILDSKEKSIINKWCYGWEMPNLATKSEFKNKMESAGFKNVQIIDKTKEVLPSSRKMYIMIGRFLKFFFKIIEFLKIKESHGGTSAVINQYCAFKNKIVEYHLFLGQKL